MKTPRNNSPVVLQLVVTINGVPLPQLRTFVEKGQEKQLCPSKTNYVLYTYKGKHPVCIGDPGPSIQRFILYSSSTVDFLSYAVPSLVASLFAQLNQNECSSPIALGVEKQNFFLEFPSYIKDEQLFSLVFQFSHELLSLFETHFPEAQPLFALFNQLRLQYGIFVNFGLQEVPLHERKTVCSSWSRLNFLNFTPSLDNLEELKNSNDFVFETLAQTYLQAKNSLPKALESEAPPTVPVVVEPKNKYDVIIVGGGLSGLTQAYRHASEFNHKVLVIEASNDTELEGGRTRSIPFQVEDVEALASIGGTWVVMDNHLTFQLADEICCMPLPDDPKFRVSNDLALGIRDANFLWLMLWFEGYRVATENSSEWWSGERARYLDQFTLNEWMDQCTSASETQKRGLRQYFWAFENYSNGPNDNFSALFAATILYKRWHNLGRTGIFPKLLRWEGGTGRFIQELKRKIVALGSEIITNKPVVTIMEEGNLVHAFCKDNTVYSADYLTVAISPRAVPWIKFFPPLPEEHQLLSANMQTTGLPGLNIYVGWRKPFWKDPTLCSFTGSERIPYYEDSFWGVNDKFYAECFELTPKIGRPYVERNPGIIRFLSDPYIVPCDKILSDETLSQKEKAEKLGQMAVDYYQDCFPKKCHSTVQDYKAVGYFNYHDLPRMPGTNLYYPKGVLSAYGRGLRHNHGRVYFGGSERGVTGLHWMEGAVARGNEVAYLIAHQLDPSINPKEKMDNLRNAASETIGKYRSTHFSVDLGKSFTDVFQNFSELPSLLTAELFRVKGQIVGLFQEQITSCLRRAGWETKVVLQFVKEFGSLNSKLPL